MTECNFRYFSPWLIVFTLIWIGIYSWSFHDPAGLFETNWPLIIVGIVGAFIGNITAIGGGIVFIPVLIFGYHLDPVSSLKLAFVSQSIGMSSGASGWLQSGVVPLNLLKWTVPSLIVGSMISTLLIQPNPMLVKSLFGPIAMIAGLLILVTFNRSGGLKELPARALFPLMLASLFGGLITGWVAIGEGEIVAAFCMLVYGLNAKPAIGLGVVLLSINSILLALVHVFYFGGVRWDIAAFTMLGALWGGRLGPFLAQWISLHKVKFIFAIIAFIDGLLISAQGIYALLSR